MEIVGPGKDAVGAVWAAQRIPDDHVSVVANSSRIGEIDLAKPDCFLASENVFRSPGNAVIGTRRAAGRSVSTRPTIPTAARKSAARGGNGGSSSLLAPSLRLEPQQQRLPAFGQTGEAGDRGEDHGALPRHLRRHRFRHGQGPHGGRRQRQDRQEPAGQPLHAL